MNTVAICEKYRPKTLEDFAFSEETYDFVREILSKGIKQNLLFYGKPGTGKTSLSQFLANHFNVLPSTLEINASKETGIDLIRDKITRFVNTSSLGCDFKLCIMSEADGLSKNAQQALKEILEESVRTGTYFIFTTNRPEKIIEEIISRCISRKIEPDKDSYFTILERNLKAEKISLSEDQLSYVEDHIYPDMRKAYNWAQGGFVSETSAADFAEIIFQFLKKNTNIEKLPVLRKSWIDQVSSFDEYEQISENLVTLVLADKKLGPVKIIKSVRSLNSTLNNYSSRRDKELNFYCSIADLFGIINEI
jgi:DNA polymerase III delta prime subunit